MTITKIHRLGFTEGTILLIHYILKSMEKCGIKDLEIENDLKDCEKNMVRWAFGTGGLYDKSIKTSHIPSFNQFPTEELLNSDIYKKYVEKLEICIGNSNKLLIFNHLTTPFQFDNKYTVYLKDLLRKHQMDPINETIQDCFCFQPCEMKKIINSYRRVVIVTCFADVIKTQIDNLNYTNLWKNTDDNLQQLDEVYYVKVPYCFMNSGPHNNFFETYDELFDSIKQYTNADLVLLSCGFYGHLLVHDIVTKLNISAVYVGNFLPKFFGIDFSSLGFTEELKIKDNWVSECPSELSYSRTDVPDIQRYFGR